MDIGKSVECPCKDCKDRYINPDTLERCHSTCKKYLKYKDKLEENRRKYQEEQEARNAYFESKKNIGNRSKAIKVSNRKKGEYRTS